nr:MAG TPA: hypothetical protein [Caudoviricetes sp.]
MISSSKPSSFRYSRFIFHSLPATLFYAGCIRRCPVVLRRRGGQR